MECVGVEWWRRVKAGDQRRYLQRVCFAKALCRPGNYAFRKSSHNINPIQRRDEHQILFLIRSGNKSKPDIFLGLCRSPLSGSVKSREETKKHPAQNCATCYSNDKGKRECYLA